MSGCRDCKTCTRSGIGKLFMFPFSVGYAILLSWNIGLFIKKCPQCGHALSEHSKRSDGSFID